MTGLNQFQPQFLDFRPYYPDELVTNRPRRKCVDEIKEDERFDVVFISTSPCNIHEFLPNHSELVIEAQGKGGGILIDKIKIMGGVSVGALVTLAYGGKEVMRHSAEVREATMAAVGYANYKMGAKIAGLGSLTVTCTRGGRDIVKYIEANGMDIRANHGDDATAGTLSASLERVGLGPDDKIQVIGANGVVGRGLAGEFARLDNPLHLYGRPDHQTALEDVADKLRDNPKTMSPEIRVITDPKLLGLADISYIVTSGGRFGPELFKEGSVIVDAAIPRGTNDDPEWDSRGIVRTTEGGQGLVSSAHLAFNPARWGVREGQLYSCAQGVFWEAWRAKLGDPVEHHVGDTDPAYIARARQGMVEELGWLHTDFDRRLLGARALQTLDTRLQRNM